MKNIHLHGHLAKQFGNIFRLDVKSPAEAVRALEANFPGKFFSSIKDGVYQVQRHLLDPGVGEDSLKMHMESKDIHIVPVLQGAKGGSGKGIVTAVLGVALIAAAVAFAPAAAAGASSFLGASMAAPTGLTLFGSAITYGQVALWGVGLALAGVSSILTPTPKVSSSNYTNRERPEERAGFLFSGAVNTTEQGGPVPLIYGEIETGSVVIHGELLAERI